jgi:hypothetical protein
LGQGRLAEGRRKGDEKKEGIRKEEKEKWKKKIGKERKRKEKEFRKIGRILGKLGGRGKGIL